jgi:hypothetical protein
MVSEKIFLFIQIKKCFAWKRMKNIILFSSSEGSGVLQFQVLKQNEI